MAFKPIDVEEKFVDAGGVRLFVRIEGKGEHPLIFLHGGPGSNHDYFVPYVGNLAQRRHIILYDQRGCGRSDRLKSSEYRSEDYVEDLRKIIRKLGFSKVDLFGHSWGGFLAQMYALKYQDTLDHLILCCTASNTINSHSRLIRTRDNLRPADKEQIEKYLKSGKHARGQPYPAEFVTFVQELQRGKSPPLNTEQYTSLIFAGFSWPVYASLMGGRDF